VTQEQYEEMMAVANAVDRELVQAYLDVRRECWRWDGEQAREVANRIREVARATV
jgi:hypothetical protein